MNFNKLSVTLFAATLSFNSFASTTDDKLAKHLSFGEPVITEVEDKDFDVREYLEAINKQEVDAGTNEILNPLSLLDVVLDKVINLGKKVWNVVEAGRPVVNLKFDSANAVPEGTKHWQQLSGWQMPISHKYQVVYTNALGMDVVKFDYRVIFTPGGNVEGKGKFLSGIAVMPNNVEVIWGYKFDVEAGVPQVFNMGTAVEPVAGAQTEVKWGVSTALRFDQKVKPYLVKGDGTFTEL